MKSALAKTLAAAQMIMFLLGAAAWAVGFPLGWMIILTPLWLLLGIAVLFWVILGGLVAKYGE